VKPASVDTARWGARFGWLAGGLSGILLGFLATYALEHFVLRHWSADPSARAASAASLVVPALFLAGALGGHAFGARGGSARYKLLGSAVGVLVSVLAWALLVLGR